MKLAPDLVRWTKDGLLLLLKSSGKMICVLEKRAPKNTDKYGAPQKNILKHITSFLYQIRGIHNTVRRPRWG